MQELKIPIGLSIGCVSVCSLFLILLEKTIALASYIFLCWIQ